MAETFKTLGQSNPAATTPTKLYAVPGATSAVVNTLVVCNQGAGVGTFRVSVRVAGAAADPKQYLLYDPVLAGNSMAGFTLGITLAATDEIWVYASSANFSFSAFGDEIT